MLVPGGCNHPCNGNGGTQRGVPHLYLDLLLQEVDFVLLLDELLLLLGDLAEGRQQGSAQHPHEGYGEGLELPLIPFNGQRERNRLGRTASSPPRGMSPVLSTVWAAREGKKVFKEQRAGRIQCGFIVLKSAIPICFAPAPPSTTD